jgi:hypothetical protein
MSIEFLNHITLNTGDIRRTYSSEINPKIYFYVRGLFKKSLSAETEVFPGYTIKSTASRIGYLITLFGDYSNVGYPLTMSSDFKGKAPILTIACSTNDPGELWYMLHENISKGVELKTKATDQPPIPYIADRVEFEAVHFIDAIENWTGDFSLCMGWICLAPEQIRGDR